MNTTKLVVVTALLLATTACGNTMGERALTGGAIGAGSGAAVGAGVGVATTPGLRG